MHNSQLVDVLHTAEDLLEEPARLTLAQPLVLDNLVEELSSAGLLDEEEEFVIVLDDFVQLHDVGVTKQFQDVDFACYSFHVCNFTYFGFLEDFDCHFFPRQDVGANFDFAKRSFADGLAD